MIRPLIEQGYLVNWQGSPYHQVGEPHHFFCGSPASDSAFCPNCVAPLLRMLSLDLSDQRLGLTESGFDLLELLFCWQCGLSQSPFFYQVLSGGRIFILRAESGPPVKGFPRIDYPRAFAEVPARLVMIDSGLSQLLEQYACSDDGESFEASAWPMETRFAVERPRHQVGGIPFLFDYESLICPLCARTMHFLATIADKNPDPLGFVDNAFVQVVFFYCARCGVVGCRQECD